MTTDPHIREQSYQYFLEEAPELLQALEQGLLNLREDCSISTVNTLMRVTHTLKGAAASVGCETLVTVAHSLEDVFRALCRPDISISPELEALLFEGFECLRLCLETQLINGTVDRNQILERATPVFARLQEQLGDYFEHNALPTSAELGFDIAQSLFEVGVAQRLEQLATILETGSVAEVAATLRTQAEVFLGLAESLNLPGFRAIAQATISALNHHPDQAITIAQHALNDFRIGQTAVLNGDRQQGGQPSEALLALAQTDPSAIVPVSVYDSNVDLNSEDTTDSADDSTDSSQLDEQNFQRIQEAIEFSIRHSVHNQSNFISVSALNETSCSASSQFAQPHQTVQPSPQASSNQTNLTSKAPSASVRVNLEHLEQLNYFVGELLTHQKRQSLQTEQLQIAIRTLFARLQQHQTLLSQLQDWSEYQFTLSTRRQIKEWQFQTQPHTSEDHNAQHFTQDFRPIPFHFNHLESRSTEYYPSSIRFKIPELDHRSEPHLLIQSLWDDTVQLTEAADAIDLLNRQSNQNQEKQQQLLTYIRDVLMESRMLPLAHILERFPPVLQQLITLHNKPVTLSLHGIDVLVDKLVAEKLYEPLLHLVRNAFDHGIEPIAIRQQRGKPSQGRIEICAYQQGRQLVIDVRDDGVGLDFEQIRQRAVERHLVSPEQAAYLTQAQLIDLLFEPGFSTVSQVSELSGRGIGLDVVRKQLQTLKGSIAVHSEPHQMTTFSLKIPLGLTIAKVLLCQTGSRTYALLPDAIEQIIIPNPNQIQQREQYKALNWNNGNDSQWVPIYPLATVLNYSSQLPQPPTPPLHPSLFAQDSGMPVILIRSQGKLLGLELEQLLGEQELVIHSISSVMSAPSYVCGASMLADGRLALVLDGITLMQKAVNQSLHSPTAQDWRSPKLPGLSSSPAQKRLPTSSHLDSSGKRESQKILIVDDSITTRQTLSLTLQKAGYQVIQASDGYEAIAQLQHHSDIQLVICDLEMHRMNGFRFLSHRQHDSTLTNIPVVILTSQSNAKYRLLAEQLGATAYINKPYLEHKLLEAIAEILIKNSLSSVSG